MQMPGCEQSVVDLTKLKDYCLNPEHPRGKHKAKVFESALGITIKDVEALRIILLNRSCDDALVDELDEYGQRYVLDFELSWDDNKAIVRSTWIIRVNEYFPTANQLLCNLGNSDMVKLLDVVALTEDLPHKGLLRGQVGTVVEELAPDVYEVEFSDDTGRTYAMAALRVNQLIVLRYEPVAN